MKPSQVLRFYYLKGHHGGYLVFDSASGSLQQRIDASEDSRVVLMKGCGASELGILFNLSPDLLPMEIDGRPEGLRFHTFLSSTAPTSSKVILRDPVTSCYLRSTGIAASGVDLRAELANTWEFFELVSTNLSKTHLESRLPEQAFVMLHSYTDGLLVWLHTLPPSPDLAFRLSILCALAALSWESRDIIEDYIKLQNDHASGAMAKKIIERLNKNEAQAASEAVCKTLEKFAASRKESLFVDALLSRATESGMKDLIVPLATSLRGRISEPQRLKFDPQRQPLSYLNLRQGLLSSDGSTILGGEGHMFLIGGSNNLLSLYLDQDNRQIDIAAGWRDILHRRKEKLEAYGASFVQIVIPEKPTALRHLFPIKIPEATYNLLILESTISVDAELRGSYLSIRKFLDGQESQEFYKRVDTHLQPLGAFKISAFIVFEVLGMTLTTPEFKIAYPQSGDLSYRFFGDAVTGLTLECTPSSQNEGRVLVEEVSAALGHHVGQRSVWSNSTAPIDLTVVAFGNSFFGSCHDQGCLGWWFSSLFRHFHHVWTPSVDYEYVSTHRPDLVICQTAERFLTILPPD